MRMSNRQGCPPFTSASSPIIKNIQVDSTQTNNSECAKLKQMVTCCAQHHDYSNELSFWLGGGSDEEVAAGILDAASMVCGGLRLNAEFKCLLSQSKCPSLSLVTGIRLI
jgi:hypothetical protein